MELYQSNAVLVKEKISDDPEEWKYMIYSVTMTDHSQYIAEEYDQTVYTLNDDGHYDVTLEISQDTSIPIDMEYLKPVVHIAELDGIQLSETNPTIELSVKKNGQLMGKKRKLHKSVADENARPV
ncbi:MAG TPA: hypothetical protein DCG19_09830 [Cryomorphaceae bacterium]|nr:hypothetical protein [Owenweeksia sp.]MBF97742.1 hypothetical protein [Owenweeksia sp.]HAD97693.1 hypothetical protein [Cryomorphaceae bacterium]HBF21836.1 hypothetical protein [Cryomorphaceae bacterium]HCQ16862.1 hypothetical protein [Cryomorphaceae bacterium]|tara:strand:+ start:590 stop:964 length:375 start_codon:yes stop_codon:yes gene_type:complete